MRVLLDARPAVDREKTGVGYYAWNLIRRLPEVDPSTTYLAWYVHLGRSPHFADLSYPNLREIGVIYPSRVLERTARWNLPRAEWFGRFDVLFGTNFLPPPSGKRRVVVTVHDVAFRMFPETSPIAVPWWLDALQRTLPRATRVLVPSESTRRDLLASYPVDPARVSAVPLAVDGERFHPPGPERVTEVRERFGLDGPYVLALGRGPRKNLPRLLSAWAGLSTDVRPRLVITGPPSWTPDGRDDALEALATLPADRRDRVTFTGYVTDPQKVALLGGAVLLAFPSLYEGFGFPALEAMACGAPVLTANVSALPELVGGAAVLVDPLDVGSIREGLERLLGDEDLRERLRAAGLERASAFDWDRTARATAAVLHQAAEA